MAQGITSGGVGAAQGTAGQLAAEQARAAEIANSGMTRSLSGIQQAVPKASQLSGQIGDFMPNGLTPDQVAAQNPDLYPENSLKPGYTTTYRPSVESNSARFLNNMSDVNAMENPAVASPLSQGFATATKFIKENPYTSAGIAYMGASKLGLLNPPRAQFGDVGTPYNGPLSKYHMSPDFKPRFADPTQFQYRPSYAAGGVMDVGRNPVEQMSNQNSIGANTGFPQAYIHNNAFATPTQTPISQNVLTGPGDTGVDPYTGEQNMATGGIAHFSAGKSVNASNLSDSLNYYNSMIGGPADQQMAQMYTPTGGQGDVGIIRDTDPDTAYLSAPEAAAVRMGKINSRSNMQGPTLPRPTPIGRINLRPQGVKQAAASGSSLDPEVNAASGGIMGANLGGYAAGGNPRLLKGPGDGMSDDIPATIADKQPARLADGEFVVPADVVSHLGNGSTDAGAKKLHQMMDTVRKARTGNQKQGKQIDPNKYLPKTA
jgi:hypothetical protein